MLESVYLASVPSQPQPINHFSQTVGPYKLTIDMDEKTFKELLTSVADWHIPKSITGNDSLAPKRKRGRPTSEEKYQIAREQIFQQEFDGVNLTFPPQLLKLKNTAVDCSDCGQHCANGRHTEKKLHIANNKRHWRERCVTCGLSRNPITGVFDLKPGAAGVVWNDFLRNRKGLYQTERNKAREDAGIITFYPDRNKQE